MYLKYTLNTTGYSSYEASGVLSNDLLRCNNVTLTFDLLTPKPKQLNFVPRCTNDKSLVNICQWIPDISQKHIDMETRTD